jgi:pimeloyl-ACP methyl ester carboxylesterase
VLVATLCYASAWGQVATDIKVGDVIVSAMIAGEGDHVVIALHGAQRNRDYFFGENGAQFGQGLANAGFRVIAVTWSGQSGGGFAETKLAVEYAQQTGAKKISLMAHSRAGELASSYARLQPDGTFDTIIQLSSVDDQGLSLSKTKKLFAFTKGDRWATWQPGAFDKSSEPKQMFALNGYGHSVLSLVQERPTLLADVVAILKK